MLPGQLHAYNIDSHYYLRYALSLSTCFNWEESHLIASGDWGMDENGSTHAEMNPVQKSNKIQWHAFGHSDERFRELWLRTHQQEELELRLIQLGQFMHFLEDWEAHAGYGIRLGHARDTYMGRDPDSLGSSQAKNDRMVQSAIDHLLATCEDLGRLDGDRDIQLVEIMQLLYDDGLMIDLYENSNPAWKRGTLGNMRKEGPEIVSRNKSRIEAFVAAQLASLPDRGIPDDFEPGSDNGIPPSLRIPFEGDGSISVDQSLAALRERASESPVPDVVLSIVKAEPYFVGPRSAPRAGWRVQVLAFNQGSSDSQEGSVEIVAVDSETESLVAETSEPLPSLSPGESIEFQVDLVSTSRPESDAILGAFARVADLSSMNDEDWLMMGDAEEEEPEIEDTVDLDFVAGAEQSVRFLSPPKFFIVENRACVLVTAVVSGGDSTEKLDRGMVEIVGGPSGENHFQQTIPSRWSAITTEEGLVGAKSFACVVPQESAFAEMAELDAEEVTVAVTLESDEAEPVTEVFALEPEFFRAMLDLQTQSP